MLRLASKCSMVHHLFCAHASHPTDLACACRIGMLLATANVHETCACSTLNLLAQGESLHKLSKGDISEVIATALTNAVNIQAPTFFANGGGPQSTLLSSSESLSVTCLMHPLMFSLHTLRLAKAVGPVPTFSASGGGPWSAPSSSSNPHVPAAIHAIWLDLQTAHCACLDCGRCRGIISKFGESQCPMVAFATCACWGSLMHSCLHKEHSTPVLVRSMFCAKQQCAPSFLYQGLSARRLQSSK